MNKKRRYVLLRFTPSAQFNTSRGLFVRLSVCVYVAGVCSRVQRRSVESDEVFIESSTSQPRFLEPHGAREEELALSCSRAAPPRCLHTTRPPSAPAPPTAGHKHTALLTVHVTQRHHHWRLIFILLLLHMMNTAAHRWETESSDRDLPPFTEKKSQIFTSESYWILCNAINAKQAKHAWSIFFSLLTCFPKFKLRFFLPSEMCCDFYYKVA